jgi:hypothetical protein
MKNATAVRRYLEALDASKPKRGRRRTAESINKRLATIADAVGSAPPLQRLALVQERLDLEEELKTIGSSPDLGPLESAFIEVARSYGEAKGISYTAWRELGVSAEVLKAAGIAQTRRRG